MKVTRLQTLVAWACMSSVLSCCIRSVRWNRVDQFVDGLSCGMTANQLSDYARSFENAETFSRDRVGLAPLVVKHGGTNVECFFEGDLLRRVQVSWISAPAKRTVEATKNLCAAPVSNDVPRESKD